MLTFTVSTCQARTSCALDEQPTYACNNGQTAVKIPPALELLRSLAGDFLLAACAVMTAPQLLAAMRRADRLVHARGAPPGLAGPYDPEHGV
jgi:hypothetical protein